MRELLKVALLPLAAGWCVAHYGVLHYNNWYFGAQVWLKAGLLAVPIALLLGLALASSWRRSWLIICGWWIAAYLTTVFILRSADLTRLSFTQVLDYEAAFCWVPVLVLAAQLWQRAFASQLAARRRLRRIGRELRLRRKLRDFPPPVQTPPPGPPPSSPEATSALLVLLAAGLLLAAPLPARAADEPARPSHDRHAEFSDQDLRYYRGDAFASADEPDGLQWGQGPAPPPWPGQYPTPAHLRERAVFWIRIENQPDGVISAGALDSLEPVGKVLSPVEQINPKGFTASGWGEPGSVCATAVNAIHVKTDQDYALGQAAIFSLVPLEFADFNPKDYLSYFNKSSTLFTDITAGEGIFGGKYAPLAFSRCFVGADRCPMPAGYVPARGDLIWIKVERLKYAPEWIEFENRFGGLVWVKEIGLDPYPIAQVLKPVVGCGRFLGTEYAGVGRIRANHPGVLDISSSPDGEIGGFQIIPRDHAMSPEMYNARFKTQWMVVGPLWALDPSWEGLPPLFGEYIYPAVVPPFNPDGTVNEAVKGTAAFLSSFEVKARYRDAEDPAAYTDMRPVVGLEMEGFKTLTHIRILFPRNGGKA